MTYAFDPEYLPYLDTIPSLDLSDLAAERQRISEFEATVNADVDTTGLVITDDAAPGPDGAPPVPVRVYVPDGAGPGTSRPALLDIHGGGFVLSSIEMEHMFAVTLVRKLGVVVVTVEYRLAPEHPFPAGVEDCYAALRWMDEHATTLGIDRDRIGVGGQSAGGGLAAATALLARDRGGPALCFQFLGIAQLDHRMETSSMRAFVDTPFAHRRTIELSWDHHGADAGEISPYASPSVAPDLRGLPPAYITAMEFDPLRDEGILYALRLMEAGVTVELHSFPGTFHGSAGLIPTAAVSRRITREMFEALSRGLATSRQTEGSVGR